MEFRSKAIYIRGFVVWQRLHYKIVRKVESMYGKQYQSLKSFLKTYRWIKYLKMETNKNFEAIEFLMQVT